MTETAMVTRSRSRSTKVSDIAQTASSFTSSTRGLRRVETPRSRRCGDPMAVSPDTRMTRSMSRSHQSPASVSASSAVFSSGDSPSSVSSAPSSYTTAAADAANLSDSELSDLDDKLVSETERDVKQFKKDDTKLRWKKKKAEKISEMKETFRKNPEKFERLEREPDSPKWRSEIGQYAFMSRLEPYQLHPEEHRLLRHSINLLQATNYLIIRNKILKLWHTTLTSPITREQAASCISDPRHAELADYCWEFLVRHGYINYGCLDFPERSKSQKIVGIIGAGVSGLSCARQLNYLFWQFKDRFVNPEDIPQVYVLEARDRLGGRVFSRPLQSPSRPIEGHPSIPVLEQPSVEIGAQVITGLTGNPLDAIIKQKGLPLHYVKGACPIYDTNGKEVSKREDDKVDFMYNDALDRVGEFKAEQAPIKTAEAISSTLIDQCRNAPGDGGLGPIALGERRGDWLDTWDRPLGRLWTSTNRDLPREDEAAEAPKKLPAAMKLQHEGWSLRPGVDKFEDVDIQPVCDENGRESLGKTLDKVLDHYKEMTYVNSQHQRLFNWHHANSEYSNACREDELSLSLWDQDEGNNFAGAHCLMVGGYSSLVDTLAEYPKPLENVYTDIPVRRVTYDQDDLTKEVVISWDDEKEIEIAQKAQLAFLVPVGATSTIEFEVENRKFMKVDKVVVTSSLGCLKNDTIQFNPNLPSWKQDAIDNLGFGVFNKVILIFDKPFWDVDNDMFGTLREPWGDPTKQSSYAANRGRFYMFWNVSKACGRPALVGLMAGEAAVQVETELESELSQEAMKILTRIFRKKFNLQKLPDPVEVIVTKWRQDEFSRGSYSFSSVTTTPTDYDNLAKSIDGKLFFAGEATCGTHPATVPGAYISGLRAAEEVLRSYIGDIQIPENLIMTKSSIEEELEKALPPRPKPNFLKRKAETDPDPNEHPIRQYYKLKRQRLDGYYESCRVKAEELFGSPPPKPTAGKANPWVLFSKDKWDQTKNELRQAGRRNVTKETIRNTLSRKWETVSPREKARYERQAAATNAQRDAEQAAYKRDLQSYLAQVQNYYATYEQQNPCPGPSAAEDQARQDMEPLMRTIERMCRLSGQQFSIDDHGNITVAERPKPAST